MARKIQRHIYFDEEMDAIIEERKNRSRRTYAEEVRILIERGLEVEGETPPPGSAAVSRRPRKSALGAVALAFAATGALAPAPAQASEVGQLYPRSIQEPSSVYSVYLQRRRKRGEARAECDRLPSAA